MNVVHTDRANSIMPPSRRLLSRTSIWSASGATSTQFSPLPLKLEVRHCGRAAVVMSCLRTFAQRGDPALDERHGVGLGQRRRAEPIRSQIVQLNLILILYVDGTVGVLDIADALRLVEVQQQEVTIEAIVHRNLD